MLYEENGKGLFGWRQREDLANNLRKVIPGASEELIRKALSLDSNRTIAECQFSGISINALFKKADEGVTVLGGTIIDILKKINSGPEEIAECFYADDPDLKKALQRLVEALAGDGKFIKSVGLSEEWTVGFVCITRQVTKQEVQTYLEELVADAYANEEDEYNEGDE